MRLQLSCLVGYYRFVIQVRSAQVDPWVCPYTVWRRGHSTLWVFYQRTEQQNNALHLEKCGREQGDLAKASPGFLTQFSLPWDTPDHRPAFPPRSSPTAAFSQSLSESNRRADFLRAAFQPPSRPQTQQSSFSFKPSQLIALFRTRAKSSTAAAELAVPLRF